MTLIVEAAMVTAGVLLAIAAANCCLLTCGIGTALALDGIKKFKCI